MPTRPPRAALERESLPLALPDGRTVALLRVRDPRARRIKLLVNENGVRLTVPRAASLRAAEAFLHAHLDWVGAQLDRFAVAHEAPALVPFATASVPLRGRPLALEWSEGRFARARLERAHDDAEPHALHLQLPPTARPGTAGRVLRDVYEAEARRDIARWLPGYLPGLPRPPGPIRLRPLSSLWGSLAPDGGMSLDLGLVLGPSEAFEYVLVHELCHLIHRDHSRAYWREVALRCPHWPAMRRWLNGGEGLAMKATLKRLLAA
jgi:predicted metal-dependent hydrolase